MVALPTHQQRGPGSGTVWSPDGRKIAFISVRDGRSDVYLIDPDGAGQTPITSNAAVMGYSPPAWSPDGRNIAFASARDGNREIYLTSTDGRRLTRLTTDSAEDQLPLWSPDGTRIAFQVVRGKNYDVDMMDADGRNRRGIATSPEYDGLPAWSSDGRLLAFISGRAVVTRSTSFVRMALASRAISEHPSLDPIGFREVTRRPFSAARV
jgi:TolB protein